MPFKQHAGHRQTPHLGTAPYDFSGQWVNELTSAMDLVVNGTTVSGKYVSAVSDAGGPTPPFDLVGSVSGELVTFSVNWGRKSPRGLDTWLT